MLADRGEVGLEPIHMTTGLVFYIIVLLINNVLTVASSEYEAVFNCRYWFQQGLNFKQFEFDGRIFVIGQGGVDRINTK